MYEGTKVPSCLRILDFNQQVEHTLTPITYKMISYHITFNFGAKGTIDLIVVW